MRIQIKNAIFKEILNQRKNTYFYLNQRGNFYIDSVIKQTITNTDMESVYYGSDFSGFYYSWDTGEIKLKALDSLGIFYGEINDKFLVEKGYNKIAE